MPVFKAYIKVIRRKLPVMSIYLGVFVIMVILLTVLSSQNPAADFTASRPRIAVINEDSGGVIAEGLSRYLGEAAQLAGQLPQTPTALQDALFFREIEYVVRIPAGFSAALLEGSTTAQVEKTGVPDSASAVYLDRLVERYLTAASRYALVRPQPEAAKIDSLVRADLAITSEVRLITGAPAGPSLVTYFFNFLSYAMMAIIFLGVSTIMLAFNKTDLRRRNSSAPVTLVQMNGQILLGHILFIGVVWAVMCVLSVMIGRVATEGREMLLMACNAFIFATACLSLSYLISLFVRNDNVQHAILNILALGSSFISGVFVPQELLGGTVTAIARFTPTYWYVRANNDLGSLAAATPGIPASVPQAMLIQLGFTAALLAVSLVVSKQRRTAAL